MAAIVNLRQLVGEIDICSQEFHGFLNRQTGEFAAVSAEEMQSVAKECERPEGHAAAADAGLPEWQRQDMATARIVLSAKEWLKLPHLAQFEEYAVMEECCRSVTDERMRERLLDAIHGRGAFSRFKRAIHQAAIPDQWYAWREQRLAAFVAAWLDPQGIPYEKWHP